MLADEKVTFIYWLSKSATGNNNSTIEQQESLAREEVSGAIGLCNIKILSKSIISKMNHQSASASASASRASTKRSYADKCVEVPIFKAHVNRIQSSASSLLSSSTATVRRGESSPTNNIPLDHNSGSSSQTNSNGKSEKNNAATTTSTTSTTSTTTTTTTTKSKAFYVEDILPYNPLHELKQLHQFYINSNTTWTWRKEKECKRSIKQYRNQIQPPQPQQQHQHQQQQFDSADKCDVCQKSDGYEGLNMQKCSSCGLFVHETCYGFASMNRSNENSSSSSSSSSSSRAGFNISCNLENEGLKDQNWKCFPCQCKCWYLTNHQYYFKYS